MPPLVRLGNSPLRRRPLQAAVFVSPCFHSRKNRERTAIRIVLAILACLVFPLTSALAQDSRGGIAFAYAPEQGMGVCVGSSPEKAMACARAKCAESGALASDCARVAWCFPAGWSVAVGLMHKEGIHWSEFSCGWPSKEAAVAAGQLRCDRQDKAFIQDCSASVVYDPDGKEIVIE